MFERFRSNDYMSPPVTEPIEPWVPEDRGEELLSFVEASEDEGKDDGPFLGAVPPGYVRVGSDATAHAASHRYAGRAGMCLRWVRTQLNVASRYSDARTAWYYAQQKHWNSSPRQGAPFFYRIGRHGHVVLANGDGTVWSTDSLRYAYADRVSIGSPVRAWGAVALGWSEYLNGVRVLPDGIIIDASQVQNCTRYSKRYTHGTVLKSWLWAEVKGMTGARRMYMTSNGLGAAFRSNARLLQKKYGFSGPWDGLLGVASLTKLTRRHSTNADVVS